MRWHRIVFVFVAALTHATSLPSSSDLPQDVWRLNRAYCNSEFYWNLRPKKYGVDTLEKLRHNHFFECPFQSGYRRFGYDCPHREEQLLQYEFVSTCCNEKSIQFPFTPLQSPAGKFPPLPAWAGSPLKRRQHIEQ